MTDFKDPPIPSVRMRIDSSFGEYQPLRDQLRPYADDPGLSRVWRRLEESRTRRRGAPVSVVLRSAALVAAGVALGMWISNERVTRVVATAESGGASMWAPSAPPEVVAERTPHLKEEQTEQSKEPKLGQDARRFSVPRRAVLRTNADGVAVAEVAEITDELPQLGPQPILPPIRPTWLLLADSGDFSGAFQQLDETDGFAQVLRSGSAEDLMTLADVARAMGRQGRAVQALRTVIERHRFDQNAPLAAMVLGNLLSRAGDARGAAEAFALNRRLAPGGDFAEDALVREFDMAVAERDLNAAIVLAEQYTLEFPEGRHQEQLKGEIARLAEALVATNSPHAKTEGGSAAQASRAEFSTSEEIQSETKLVESETVGQRSGDPGAPGEFDERPYNDGEFNDGEFNDGDAAVEESEIEEGDETVDGEQDDVAADDPSSPRQ